MHSGRISRELALGVTGSQAETMAAIDLARRQKAENSFAGLATKKPCFTISL
jgi:hypothetical protein